MKKALKTKRDISGTSRLTVQLRASDENEQSRMLTEGHINSNYDCCGLFPVKIEATVLLEKNCAVWVQLTEGSIYGTNRNNLTTFGGFFLGLSTG